MSEPVCAVAAETKLETPEGPLTTKTILATPTAVMTRTDDRTVRFAISKEAQKSDGPQPVLRLTLSNGNSFRIGPNQVLLKYDMQEVCARDLQPGDELESVFSFPEGYEYTTDDGEKMTSKPTVTVSAVEPGGEAELYSFRVNLTGRFLFSAGVLGKAEGV